MRTLVLSILVLSFNAFSLPASSADRPWVECKGHSGAVSVSTEINHSSSDRGYSATVKETQNGSSLGERTFPNVVYAPDGLSFTGPGYVLIIEVVNGRGVRRGTGLAAKLQYLGRGSTMTEARVSCVYNSN